MTDLVERARALALAIDFSPDDLGGSIGTASLRNPDGKELLSIVEALSERIAVLEGALKPFAEAADIKLCGEWAYYKHFGQTDIGFALTFGDLRAARKSLTQEPQ